METVGSVGKTILVVYPNTLDVRLVRDLLEYQGHTVLAARDTDAMTIIRQRRPDLVLFDTYLGLDFIGTLKADVELRSVPIVAITASTSLSEEERIRTSGCDGVLVMPFSLPGFLEIVERFVGSGVDPAPSAPAIALARPPR